MSSLVTVIIGQVGDGFAPIAHYCQGTVYVIIFRPLKDNDDTALIREDLNLNFVYINFFNALSSYKTIKNLKKDILDKYGGIDVLINTCTYNFEADANFNDEYKANTLVNFNCLSVMKVCEILYSALKSGHSTVIYCALKYDYLSAIPDINIKKTIQDNKLTSHQLTVWLNQYLEATKQNSHKAIWGNVPYAVSKAGFVALKNIHKRKFQARDIKVIHDYTIKISIAPVNKLLIEALQHINNYCEKRSNLQENQSKVYCEVNEEGVVNRMSPVSELGPVNEKNPVSASNPVDEKNPISKRNPVSEVNTVSEVYSDTVVNPVNEMNLASEKNPINEVSTMREVATCKVITVKKKSKRKAVVSHIENCENIKKGKSNDNTAISTTSCRSLHLNVAITNKEADLTAEEAAYIQKELHNALFALCNEQTILEQTCIPAFDKNPIYNEGVVKFWCHDENALAWLTNAVAKLKLSSDCKLDIIDQRDIPGRVKAALFIPDFDKNLKDLQALLYYQNPWYNVNLWKLCSYETTTNEKPSGMFLILSIPKVDVLKIVERKQKVHYAMGTVNMKFINNTGFSDKPLTENNSVNNWQLIPIAKENDTPDTSISLPTLTQAFNEIDGFLENNLEFSWDESNSLDCV